MDGASSASGVRPVIFRPYITGRILKLANYARFKIEGRDRTLARAGPTAGSIHHNRRRHQP